MTQKDFIITVLSQNNGQTTAQLVDIYYEQLPHIVETRRNQYIAQNKPKTEKELKTQIHAELGSCLHRLNESNQVTTTRLKNQPNTHIINPNAIQITIVDEQQEDLIPDKNDPAPDCFGTVYLMKSQTFKNTYKIGITSDLDRRTKELRKDHRYGAFVLKPIASIECQDYTLVERVLHKFFEDFRLSKGNDNNDVAVDTELFIDIETIEEEFKLFCELISKNPRFKNTNINQNLSETKVL